LHKNGLARGGWHALKPSRQKEIVCYLANLKSPAVQQRNPEKTLHVLRGGRARFGARSSNS